MLLFESSRTTGCWGAKAKTLVTTPDKTKPPKVTLMLHNTCLHSKYLLDCGFWILVRDSDGRHNLGTF